ncbi:uncharacterized protein LOC114363404 [Ostrinia furnacalis]|uniref:uncharacterized protein LOC114363404 n=1 Tax=Ostrinia furnacalis TaxID=93504 RepID=UPI00103BC937|nr:uncharacterized protein LOC114363404 [Ostrinia furnacalis]
MASNSFMDKIKSFFGLRQEPPRNDFRNPIWGNDDDDVDELYSYSQHQMQPYVDPAEMQKFVAKQMQDMFKSFGSMFGDMKVFFHDDQYDAFAGFADIPEADNDSNNIRDYYLKPGYQNRKQEHHEDIDLDGKLSSHDISGLLKQKENGHKSITPFNGDLVPGRSFCQTIITTSVTKPDGSIETRRIIKNGNEVVEETTTTPGPGPRGPFNSNMDPITSTNFIYNNIMSEFSSLFRNFY